MRWVMSWVKDKTLRGPLPSWYCRICGQLIDYNMLRLNPGEIYCIECKWKMREAIEGRR